MSDLFVEHLLITLIGAVPGVLVGMLAGMLIARILTRFYSGSRQRMNLAILLPWRTILFGLMVQLIVPVLLVLAVGIGIRNGFLSIGIASAGVTAAASTGILIRKRFGRSELVELIASARSVTAGTSALLVVYGLVGSGGLGFATMTRFRTFQFDEAARAYLLILATILTFDLIGGGLQFLAGVREVRGSNTDSCEA